MLETFNLLLASLFFSIASVYSAEEPLTTIVCFGDSITKRGYPQILGELVGAETVNAGVAGHNSSQGLRRIKNDVLEHEPDIVVIFFGTNDIRVDSDKAHVPLKNYRQNLLEIIKKCVEIGAKPVLCSPPPILEEVYFKRHERAKYEQAGGLKKLLADYSTAVKKIATEQKIPLVDLNTKLVKETTWLHSDGVHPSPKGNAIIAKCVEEVLKAQLIEPQAEESK